VTVFGSHIPSRGIITSHPGQLSLLSSVERTGNEYRSNYGDAVQPGTKGMVRLVPVVDKRVTVAREAAIYTVSQKNYSDVAHYNFNSHQPILAIFGRDIAERICY